MSFLQEAGLGVIVEPDKLVRARRVARVLLAVAVLSVGMATAPQILSSATRSEPELGSWVFLVIVLMGTAATMAGTLRSGALAGCIAGFLLSVTGSTTHFLLTGQHAGEELRILISGAVILSVMGSVLGIVGGLPIKLWRWTRHR